MRALLLAVFLLPAPRAFAATEVHIKVGGKGSDVRVPLELTPFAAQTGKTADAELATQLTEIVRADLLFSRHFELVAGKEQGAAWRLEGTASVNADQIALSAKLVDLASGDSAFERYYRQDARFPRSAAHKLADDVVRQLTGKTGIAHTQIAYSVMQGGKKEIWLADYDGANARQLTRHASISILPRLAPDRRSVIYTSYKDGNPDLFRLDLANGGLKALSNDQGLNVGGGFSPDGTQLLMTLSRQRSPNLYLKSLSDGSVTQLTQHFGADSSPTFSPDAQQVAFVSDRSGNPQIYVLDLTTRRARRLTSLNWCDSPSWSPTGEWIAFAGRQNPLDKLDIYLVDVTGGQMRQLTRLAGSNENPTWSADGRFLAFTSTRDGKSQLFVMDADGSAPHKLLDAPGPVGTPDWSR